MKSGISSFGEIEAGALHLDKFGSLFDVIGGLFRYASYENDFIRFPDYDATNEWTLTQAGVGSAALGDDIDFGILTLTNAGADNNWDEIQFTGANAAGEWISLDADKEVIFECRIAISEKIQSDAFVGLCITDADISDAGSGVPAASDYLGFAKDDGDANWDFVAAKNSIETAQSGVATAIDAAYQILTIVVDGISKATCYIDGVRGPSISTNLPDDEQLCVTFFIQNGEAVAKSLSIDYVRVYRER